MTTFLVDKESEEMQPEVSPNPVPATQFHKRVTGRVCIPPSGLKKDRGSEVPLP